MDEGVVILVFPTGFVVGVVRAHEVEESGGIDEVADPAGAGDVVFEVLDGLLEDFPFLVVDGDIFDAEVCFPHVLDGDGDGLVTVPKC